MLMFNILSLDGGGLKGALTARILQRVAEQVPNWLDKIDLIAGTSTGGLIACSLAYGLPPAELVALYRERGHLIFPPTMRQGMWWAKYHQEGLRHELSTIFGETKLGDLEKFVLIPAFDLKQFRPKYYENMTQHDDVGLRVVNVALATSAAPTYLPDAKGMIDGGVMANNPTLAAIVQTQDPKLLSPPPPLDSVRTLSIGTGRVPHSIDVPEANWGVLRYGTKLLDILMDGNNDSLDYMARMLLGDRHLRVQVELPFAAAMDDMGVVEPLIQLADAVDIRPMLAWLDQVPN